MTLPFTKMHGAGNDYVYVDCVTNKFHFSEAQLHALARAVSNRHKGIGSDGLVLIMPSDAADFRMRMFNADGSEAEMCGNASRCVGKYVFEHSLTNKDSLLLETKAGIKKLFLNTSGNSVESVTVGMGKVYVEDEIYLPQYDARLQKVNVGNPHAVWFVTSLDNIDVNLGAQIEVLPCFPEKTNVEFAEVINPHEIRMRVWERGTGETMACGTGACAVAAAAMNKQFTSDTVLLHLPGGDLRCEIDKQGDIWLSGPAEEVFNGIYSCNEQE